MEPNDTHTHLHFTSYFTTTTASAAAVAPSPTNGLAPQPTPDPATVSTGGGVHHQPQQLHPMVYPTHSVGPSSAAVTSAPVERRKRGRPRKYGTPEQALAAKKAAPSSSSSHHHSNSSNNKENKTKRGGGDPSPSSPFYSTKKSQQPPFSLGNVGLGFTPHVINVAAGEDVSQKLMMFLQQSKREMCILSASGTISNASLRQPATAGVSITYEGRFEIISLSGSYVRSDIGGKTGGLSVCLSGSDGQIVGGGVGGPLKAAGPVQVIVGTFLLDQKKDAVVGGKGDASASKLPSPVGGMSASSVGFRSPVDSSGRSPIHGNDEHQTMGGNPFMIQHHGMLVAPARPTDWRDGPDARTLGTYDFSGRTGHGAHQSPENGDYEQLPD